MYMNELNDVAENSCKYPSDGGELPLPFDGALLPTNFGSSSHDWWHLFMTSDMCLIMDGWMGPSTLPQLLDRSPQFPCISLT